MFRRLVVSMALGAGALMVAGGACAQDPAPAPPAPQPAAPVPGGPSGKIAFDAMVVNLGDVVHGQDAVATFTYHNTGDAPLHILSAKPG